jgi:transposase
MQCEHTVSGGFSATRYTQPEKALSLSVKYWAFNLFVILLRALMEILGLKAEIAGLRSKVEVLEAENQKLYERLHLDSSTSSVPSSKGWKGCGGPDEQKGDDQEGAADPDNGRETPIQVSGYINGNAGEKRKPGGQKKHKPAFMHIDDAREGDSVLHYPSRCVGCPRFDQCLEDGRFRKNSTAHEYDIEIIRIHRLHIKYEVMACPGDGDMIRERFPEVLGSQYYGSNVQLNVLTWHHIFHASYERIGLAAKELLGLSLSAGTANAIVCRTSVGILDSRFMDAARFFILLYEAVMGSDETSARVNGMNAWVHTAVTDNVTILTAHWRRGYEGMTHAGVLQFFVGTLISDCWTSYFNDNFKFSHALCDGHILRELVAAAYFRGQRWAIDMFDLLLEILTDKREAIERGEKSFAQQYINDIVARYRQVVADGFNENHGVQKGKTFALIERLRLNESAVLAFATDFRVKFTNNASEISLRDLKVALRVMGQFKTMSGLADYCVIESFMDTCRKQGRNPYDMLRVVLSGGDVIAAVFGAEKSERIKEIIGLADTFDKGDQNEINAAIAKMSFSPSEKLLAAVSYGRYEVLDTPPPEKKNKSSTIPKDKMQAAREAVSHPSFSKNKLQPCAATATAEKVYPEPRAGPVSA